MGESSLKETNMLPEMGGHNVNPGILFYTDPDSGQNPGGGRGE